MLPIASTNPQYPDSAKGATTWPRIDGPRHQFARIVRRRTPTWPTRWASYFDFTPWRGGYSRCTSAPGAVVLPSGHVANIRSGRVTTTQEQA